MSRPLGIIEILDDVVRSTPKGCVIKNGGSWSEECSPIKCPAINYTFGNAQYIKDKLDILSKTQTGNARKFPLIALFCPFNERRDSPDYYSKAKVRILIACATRQEWSNEERLAFSFENVLRPIYNGFIKALKEDGRFDFGYDGTVRHEYSENYSYGRYGAHTGTGEAVSEPIDAINISNLELTVKNQNCRQR